MKKVLSGVVVVLMLVGLVACGGSDAPVVGNWELARVAYLGEEYGVVEFLEMSGTDLTTVTMEIKANGTWTASMPGTSGGGKWSEKDGTYEMQDGSDTVPMSYNEAADEVTLTSSGVDMVFTRA